ncbi:MAG: hypothetical protein ABI823_17780 [Bryobacteraceae bacterium]
MKKIPTMSALERTESVKPDLSKLSVRQFAERMRSEMIPLSNSVSYFCASVPMSNEDFKEYVEEPIAALPPGIAAALPKIRILLVPYLEKAGKANGKASADYVSMEKPSERRSSLDSDLRLEGEAVLVFALKDQEIAEYHYRLYRRLAALLADQWTEAVRTAYARLIREELTADAHGEVDDASWSAKQTLLRRQKASRTKESPAYTAYLRQSFIDTLTLYLHGLCCDIDVETGPRQLPSRYLRKRLELLRELYPPAEGYALFPEELK